jgi:hypothetical protein
VLLVQAADAPPRDWFFAERAGGSLVSDALAGLLAYASRAPAQQRISGFGHGAEPRLVVFYPPDIERRRRHGAGHQGAAVRTARAAEKRKETMRTLFTKRPAAELPAATVTVSDAIVSARTKVERLAAMELRHFECWRGLGVEIEEERASIGSDTVEAELNGSPAPDGRDWG